MQHRRHRLERAPLELQVLADQRRDRAPHAYSPRTSASVTSRRRRPDRLAPAAQAEHPVGLGQALLGVVGDQHARRPGRRGRSAARPRPRRPGRGSRAARRAAAARARAARRGRSRRAGSSRARACARGRRRARARPTCSHSASTRAGVDAVQARVEAQVLAHRQVAVEQRLVREQPDPPARAATPRAAARRRAPTRGRRAAAAARRGSAAASSCRRRWRRTRRPSRPAGSVKRDVAQRDALAVGAADPLQRDGGRATRRWRPLPWLESPRSVCTACSSTGAITGKSCSTAFGLPGKLTISVDSAMPAIPRVRIPSGVWRGRLGAHRLGQAGRLAVDHHAGRLRRDVVGRHARSRRS